MKTVKFILIMQLFALYSCKCEDTEGRTTDIPDLDKAYPYSGNETLRFLKNKKDTILFVGQGKINDYDKEAQTLESSCSPINKYQKMSLIFKSVSGETFSYKSTIDGYNNNQLTVSINDFWGVSSTPAWAWGNPQEKDTAFNIVYDTVCITTIQKYHSNKDLSGYVYGSITFKPRVGIVKMLFNIKQPFYTPQYDVYELMP